MADKAEKKKQKKQGTISQIIQIFKYTQAEDKALPWLCGGVFVAPIVVFVVLGVIFKWHVFSWILFMILADVYKRQGLTRRPRTPSGAVPVTTASICWAKAITIASSEPWIVRSSASRA